MTLLLRSTEGFPALAYSGLFAIGIVLHIAYFHHGEHHMYSARYFLGYVALQIGMILASVLYGGMPIGEAVYSTLLGTTCVAIGLFTSLTVSRVYLSPLRKFPGPFGARLSDLYFAAQCRGLDAFRQVHRYHRQFGDYVRLGSNTISITDPNAIDAIYGPHSLCRKADWYDIPAPMYSLQTARVKAVHDQRRRMWSNAFSTRALRGYEVRINHLQDILFRQISGFIGQPIDVTKWFGFYNFDVMGDLAFGADLAMMLSQREHWAIKLMKEGLLPIGYHLPTWIFRLMLIVPGLIDDWWKFIAYCRASLEARMRNKPEVPDIMSALLSSYGDEIPSAEEMRVLTGDSQLIVTAGSDTTATTMTFLLYELGKHPEHFDILRKEIEPCFSADGSLPKGQDLQYLPHLNAVINETLRLHPPVPTALRRLTPPEGIEINGTYIPGGTVVWCPQYAICRSENCFTHADAFIPERWTSRPDLVVHRAAFAPFSIGPYGCIGRPLALLNLQTTIARLLQRFDVEFAPGVRPTVEEKTTEHFTLVPGELMMVFRERSA